MDIINLLKGESDTVEYKEFLPDKSIKYIKTVVAFANGNGGTIVFGVQDKTCSITGIPRENVFKVMDSIATAIGDSCYPTIIPEIITQEIDGKPIVILHINSGYQKPYYVKSLGLDNGVFLRVGGTSRPVERYMLKELVLEGMNSSFDRYRAEGISVADEEINKLCSEMTEYAREKCQNDAERDSIKPVTKNQLFSWELLVQKDGVIYPTNGLCLLAGIPIPGVMAEIQCAVFKGNNRSIFIDRKTYNGPIYKQIDEAYKFVLRSIRMGAEIEGIQRRDIYELPISAIRELIANAVCHRSYLHPANVQIALYDDRLEVTSPGMLTHGITLEQIKEGYSKVRNQGIAKAFAYMKIIEAWGSGIPRIFEECVQYKIAPLELIEFGYDFRAILRRNIVSDTKSDGKISEKVAENPESDGKINKNVTKNPESDGKISEKVVEKSQSDGKVSTEEKILRLISENNEIKYLQIAEILHMSESGIRRAIGRMKNKGILHRENGNRKGKWIIDKY